jgi:hypothetical protein
MRPGLHLEGETPSLFVTPVQVAIVWTGAARQACGEAAPRRQWGNAQAVTVSILCQKETIENQHFQAGRRGQS